MGDDKEEADGGLLLQKCWIRCIRPLCILAIALLPGERTPSMTMPSDVTIKGKRNASSPISSSEFSPRGGNIDAKSHITRVRTEVAH